MNKILTPEELCRVIVRYYIKSEIFYNYRPDWLENPKTGRNLELDIYIPDRMLALEIQGLHHQTIKQILKDELKERVCKERGIKLIKIETLKQLSTLPYLLVGIKGVKYIPPHILRKIELTKSHYEKFNRIVTKEEFSHPNYWNINKRKIWREVGVLAQRRERESVLRRRELREALRTSC